ncbi:hypothetical protein PLANPX_0225 [Lacipirellula parvula]|uniref:Uncharacterized protein n=1 Tax=Lacipirellula parvula TaxID=2650471 RepID=A0A5K7X838_9BACT|nr:hypothetical protein PLANPX_0225 [Lacipirellula parvula]
MNRQGRQERQGIRGELNHDGTTSTTEYGTADKRRLFSLASICVHRRFQ